LSLLLNKPTISISFHDKCSSVMRQMGMAEYILDINDLNSETLMERFCRLKENAESLKTMLAERAEEHRDALDEQYRSILDVIWPGGERALGAEMRELYREGN
ncbi:MAG TPA: hypothetical protein VGY31_08150, partial [Terriglobia bacterium]|nr:hypothetical protein [Terriglobia bacterium]